MKELDIKISYQCNNACIFCLNRDKKYQPTISIDEAKRQIDAFAKNGGEKLIVSGGEPIISKNFFDLLVFAKEKGIKLLEIQTNARMLCYEKIVKKLKKFEPMTFLISFHFPNSRLYRKYCQADGFQQTVQGIKNLVKYNCKFGINTVLMKPNFLYLKTMIKMLRNMGVRNVQYRFIDGKNVIKDYKKFVPRYKDCQSSVEEIIKENKDLNLFLREIPICVLGKESREHLAPLLNHRRLNFNSGRGLMLTKDIEASQFIFPNCKNCIYKINCQGVRKEYAQIYGNKEFKPITIVKN
jgi:molybdenum cofactor biosynthesis enzyme MoaA